MAWQLVFTDSYTKAALRFLRRHPELKAQYAKTLALLEANPHHPSLRLHALKGRLNGLHSVSINLSYRITLELLIDGLQKLTETRLCVLNGPLLHHRPLK